MVVDFRKLNAITSLPRFPLPRADDILSSLHGSTIFSQIDLNSGYYQVGLQEDQCYLTSFVLPFGQYEFRRMPFGLAGAPMTFQRLMTNLFLDLEFVKVFLDDILIHSTSEAEHAQHLRQVFQRLQEANLTINLEKSNFFCDTVTYLGYTISYNTVKPAARNLESLLKLPAPTNIRGVRRIMGSLNFFRNMIPHMSTRLAPISDLTSASNVFKWSDDLQKIVTDIIQELINKAETKQPLFGHPFQLYCDASDFGIGSILCQDANLIACYSAKFTGAQSHYTTTEKEALAVISSLQHWRSLLFGQKIHIFTDHSNLQFMNSSTIQRIQR
jgi:hypothetical protein